MKSTWAATFRHVGSRGAFAAALGAATLAWDANAQAPAPTPDPGAPPPGNAPTPGPSSTDAPPPADTPPPALAESPLTQENNEPPPPTYAAEPPPPEPPPPEAEAEPDVSDAGPFSRGSVRLSVLIGTGSSVSDTYLILGAGIGYFLVDGLEVGLDYDIWFLADPVLNRLSPETRYVFHMIPVVKPYVGAFYRHTFVADYDDFDYVGARAGAYIIPSRSRSYIGAGAVFEHMLDCEDSAFLDCDSVYPEITFGISF